MNRIYLSLGSNISPEDHLQRAVKELMKYGDLLAVSSVWESAPVGYLDQPDFLNAAVLIQTALPAETFQAEAIPEIENTLGRVRGEIKDGPRTIDIDIMLVNDAVFSLGGKPIPSPEILERPFVAIPLAEVDPAFCHPITGQRLDEIAAGFQNHARNMRCREDIGLHPSGPTEDGKMP